MLWVVDDPPTRATSGASVAPLSAWRCPLPNARTLLTTRVGGQAGYTAVYVGVLEVEPALGLLRRGAAWTDDALVDGRGRFQGSCRVAVDHAACSSFSSLVLRARTQTRLGGLQFLVGRLPHRSGGFALAAA